MSYKPFTQYQLIYGISSLNNKLWRGSESENKHNALATNETETGELKN